MMLLTVVVLLSLLLARRWVLKTPGASVRWDARGNDCVVV